MSNEIEQVTDSQSPAIVDDREANIAKFKAVVESMKATNVDEDPEMAMESMIAQVMGAIDVSDVLGNTVTGLKDMLKVPMMISSVELRPSDFEQGLGAYAVIHCQDDAGNSLVVTTGSFMVIVQLAKFHELNAYPLRCMAVEATKPTKGGYYPLSLTRAPDKEESF